MDLGRAGKVALAALILQLSAILSPSLLLQFVEFNNGEIKINYASSFSYLEQFVLYWMLPGRYHNFGEFFCTSTEF